MSLIERLREQAAHFRKVSPALTDDGWLMLGDEAADRLEAMQAEIEQANVDLLVVADAVNPEAAQVLRRIARDLRASIDNSKEGEK